MFHVFSAKIAIIEIGFFTLFSFLNVNKTQCYSAVLSHYQKSIRNKYGENSQQYLNLLDELKVEYTIVEDTLNIQKISKEIESILFANLEKKELKKKKFGILIKTLIFGWHLFY